MFFLDEEEITIRMKGTNSLDFYVESRHRNTPRAPKRRRHSSLIAF
jgi:hypothetical protein